MSRLPQTDQAAALLRHARAATPFTSEDGQPCASVPASLDSRHVLAIRSAAFRDWLTAAFYSEFETVPAPAAFRAVLRTLEARARYTDFPRPKLNHRLGFEGDPFFPAGITLDLANSAGEVIEIDSHGWRIRDNMHHSFRQSLTTLALPRPSVPHASTASPAISPPTAGAAPSPGPAAIERFAQLFSLDPAARARVLAWLLTALRPAGPYPILVLHGPAASGKTLLARALRALIDPAPALIRRLPGRDQDFMRIAFENWILCFDDVCRLSPKIAESLCAVSSGDALRVPQPDSRDALELEIVRPIILVAPQHDTNGAWFPPRGLSNRTTTVRRKQVSRPQPESALWSEFERLRPALLATLAQAVSTALHRIRDIEPPNVARFPDAAVWCSASAPALGLTENALVAALTDPLAVWTGSDPLGDALRALIAPHALWTGDAAALLDQLRSRPAPSCHPRPKACPKPSPASPDSTSSEPAAPTALAG